jgi:hypothetical protein
LSPSSFFPEGRFLDQPFDVDHADLDSRGRGGRGGSLGTGDGRDQGGCHHEGKAFHSNSFFRESAEV